MSQGYRPSPSYLWEISEKEITLFQSTIGLNFNYLIIKDEFSGAIRLTHL
jgi:hypothetical protein